MKNVNPKTAVFFWFLCIFAVIGFVFFKVQRIEEEKEAGIGVPVAVSNQIAQQDMMNTMDMEKAEHQNGLDMSLNQSKEKNPQNESYKPVLGLIKKTLNG